MSKRNRKLIVDDVEYLYTIGKKNVKIVSPTGTLAPKVEEVGIPYCWDQYFVTPRLVKAFIQGVKLTPEDVFPNCCDREAERSVRADPFDAEIHEKLRLVSFCNECYDNRRFEI